MSAGTQHNGGRRITLKYKQPNPLFEKWLEEWKSEAAARGSQMEHCFAKALASLKRYPLPLNSGKECGVLQNFGNRLCVMLDRKLVEYKKQNPECVFNADFVTRNKVTENKLMSNSLPHSGLDSTQESTNSHINKNARKEYKNKKSQKSPNSKLKRQNCCDYAPAYRSGPYGILLGMLTCCQNEGYPGYVSKADLIKVAQPFCDSSYSKQEHGPFYNAWSSMSTLMKKGFVSTRGRGKYSLTTTGEQLAKKLKNITQEQDDHNMKRDEDDTEIVGSHIVPTSNANTAPAEKSSVEQKKRKMEETSSVILEPGSFEVLLLVDNHETSGISGSGGRNDTFLNDLHKQNINAEVCDLKVGDFAWICRDKTSGQELVLPYVVERKRIDDFARSIMDGRFREQKFRLKRCGIPHCIYLVEKHGQRSHIALPLSSLNQAAANVHVIDEFFVKYTSNNKESALYLAYFTQFLRNLFKPKTLVRCNKDDLPQFCVDDEVVSLMSFKEFNSSSKKTKKLCVQDMFIKQLLQLNGLSVDKALAIVDRFPTPRALSNALKMDPNKKLIAEIPYGTTNRRIGPVLGKVITELYTNTVLR